MVTKTLGWAVVSLGVVCLVWWCIDPIGFAHNPAVAYLKTLSLKSSGYYR